MSLRVCNPLLEITHDSRMRADNIWNLAMTSLLTQNLASHKDLLHQRSEEIDRLNEQLREFSAAQQAELEKIQEVQARLKQRDERNAQFKNLRRAISERKSAMSPTTLRRHTDTATELGTADAALLMPDVVKALDSLLVFSGEPGVTARDQLSSLPPLSQLRATVGSFTANNAVLRRKADELHSRSSELEVLYRRVVSLCTGVAEGKVEEALPSLVAAIESERSGGTGQGDVTRVREFLRRVEGGNAVGQAMAL